MPSPSQRYMVETIEAEARAATPWVGNAQISPGILAVMAEIPRHEFVPAELAEAAYQNSPLPIGHRQTISQPYIVALMTDLLAPTAADVVLEVGTGSGYQAAVLSRLVRKVYSLEIIDVLAQEAAARLHRLGYGNVEISQGNGRKGWPEHGPYDGIVVTAGAEAVPQALIDQLKPGGRLVIPVNSGFYGQTLKLLRKQADGQIREQDVLPVAFVPLTGGD